MSENQDYELVIALVAPIGVNLDDVFNRLRMLLDQFRYEVNLIHLSELAAKLLEGEVIEDVPKHNEAARLRRGMRLGNKVREKLGRGDALAVAAIDEIYSSRPRGDHQKQPLGRVAHIIRSLKHPDEAETLRDVYGPGFFLLGVSSSVQSRREYLTQMQGISVDDTEALIKRDDSEELKHGQRTRDVFQLADAFVASDAFDFDRQVARFLDLIFGKPVEPTKQAEFAMFMAYAAALRSADLSRQVGAVILSKDGEVVATGANDVPKAGGGLYWPGDDDQRDFVKQFDSNEKQKEKIILRIMKKIHANGSMGAAVTVPSDEVLIAEGKELLDDTGVSDITEYGRAVHAEMEAILSCSRVGVSLRGGTLYTTTYPCHNCAKHIVAAGISKVVYIEPYPKSYALQLHDDSIEVDGKSKIYGEVLKVKFEAFVGVGPRRFIDLFSMKLSSGRKLKRKGMGMDWERKAADARVPLIPMSYIDKEAMLLAEGGNNEDDAAENHDEA